MTTTNTTHMFSIAHDFSLGVRRAGIPYSIDTQALIAKAARKLASVTPEDFPSEEVQTLGHMWARKYLAGV